MFGNNCDCYENVTPIDKIELSILGNPEVLNLSVFDSNSIGITSTELYMNTECKEGGLNDKLMGTTDKKSACITCGFTTQYCNGHSGHIKLALPIYHIGFYDDVVNIIQCVCINCSVLLISNNDFKDKINNIKSNKSKLIFIKNNIKQGGNCKKCNTPIKVIRAHKKKDDVLNIQTENINYDENKKQIKSFNILQSSHVYNVLKNISDEDVQFMGLKTRPENLMLTNLIVPSIPFRPSSRGDFGTIHVKEDHLTMHLNNILKTNFKAKKSLDEMKFEETYTNLLQISCALYFNNKSFTAQTNKGIALKDLVSRIKGKEGRIRYNLMGKRVNFSARTVITPNPYLSINELGVPKCIAMKLTYPEIVTPLNKEKLMEYVKNGEFVYVGAINIIKKSSNYTYKITINKNNNYTLEYGDIVERHLIDGDIVILNRQPTLHKHGTLGHRIKIIMNPHINTFMINPSICKGYNADFDGDEMNIHTVQSTQTQIEVESISDIKYQIINPRMSLPIVGIVFDSLIGSYNLTRFIKNIDINDYMNLLSSIKDYDSVNFDKEEKNLTGIDLFNNLIPKNINLTIGDGAKNLKVIDSKITEGYINANSISNGYKTNTLQQLILDEYGVETTMDFINNVIKLAINFNLINGFTIGIGDFLLNKEQFNNKIQVIETKKLEIETLITEYENNPDIENSDIFEYAIFNKLIVIRADLGEYLNKTISNKNNAIIMMDSGSKGSITNLTQIMCCRGQLDVFSAGKRIYKNFNNRSLPYFFQNDDRPKARAFIENSFMEGMSLSENIFEIMTCRESQIDTAVKTADTGYIQRKLIKSAEDVSVFYDGSVRSSNNKIKQFIYGDSGADTCRQYLHHLTFYDMNNNTIKDVYKFTDIEMKKVKNFNNDENNEFYKMIINMRTTIRDIYIKVTLNYLLNNFGSFHIPVNLKRIIDSALNLKFKDDIEYDVKYIIERIEFILLSENTLLIPMSKNDTIKKKDEEIAKTLFRFCLYDIFSPKKCIFTYKFTKLQIDYVVEQIILYFNKSMVESGEMVGILGAQCLGEPATQITLKSFHHSGVGGKSSAGAGIARLKEILQFTKTNKISTPLMKLYFDDDHKNNKEYAMKIYAYLKYTILNDVKNIIEIYYDPLPYDENSIMKNDNIDKIFAPVNKTKYSCIDKIDNLPWLIRIELNKEQLFLKEITLLDIKTKFSYFWENRYDETKRDNKKILERVINLALLSNDDNDDTPILHIRFDMNVVNFNILKDFMDIFIIDFKLKGIENIEDSYNENNFESIYINQNNESGEIIKEYEQVIETKGINLTDIRNIVGIDINRTITTDLYSIYTNFGIEAVRTVIINEIIDIFSNKGESQNRQHVAIFADLMTNIGIITPISHHGINKLDTDVFARASFERPVQQIIEAGIFGMTDNLKSVSSRVMIGKPLIGGTGMCDILLNTEQIINSEYVYDINNYNKNFNNITIKSDFEVNEDVFIPDF